MSTIVSVEALICACEDLLSQGIPYDEMDCQAAFEAAYEEAGVPGKECNLAGSNAHFRASRWAGTPERFRDVTGLDEVPAGMSIGILKDDGGEPAKYRSDNMGNCDHIGIIMATEQVFNSSEKRGGIVVSTTFDGANSVPNGGWNLVMLSPWCDAGLTEEQISLLIASDGGDDAETEDESSDSASGDAVVNQINHYIDSHMVIKRGCKGSAVKVLQTALNAINEEYALTVDHDFGPKTEAAVLDFQQTHDLEDDGIVGPLTWAALAEAYEAVAL